MGTEIPVAYFARGLIMVDIKDPYRIQEVGRYTPDFGPGKHAHGNDCCWDDRGLIYLLDRVHGLYIMERKNGAGPKSVAGAKRAKQPAMASRRPAKKAASKAKKKAPAKRKATRAKARKGRR